MASMLKWLMTERIKLLLEGKISNMGICLRRPAFWTTFLIQENLAHPAKLQGRRLTAQDN